MATATQIRDAAESEILTRLQRGAIERYSLADGRSVQKSSLSELLKVRSEFVAAARDEENGSSIAIFRWI